MFSRYPLLYISIKYLFFTKDKIVFFMQQFSLLIISLSIATIFATFSIVNGFEDEMIKRIISNNSHVIVTPNINMQEDFLENIKKYNEGFKPLEIKNEKIKDIKYIKDFYTFIFLNKQNYKAQVIEVKEQNEKILVNQHLYEKLQEEIYNDLSIGNPFSYNPEKNEISEIKSYYKRNIKEKKDGNYNFVIYLSQKEFNKFIKNDTINKIQINVKNISDSKEIKDYVEQEYKNKNIQVFVKSWEDLQPHLIYAIDLQKKIFLLIYFVMFLLLSAIIIATNIAFFKEKRKDWALLTILNVIPNSVIKIFTYKNFITFLLSNILGLGLGAILSIYSNEILSILTNVLNFRLNTTMFFGLDKLTYIFKLKDILIISLFSFFIFFINFIILMRVFKKENISILIKN